MVIANNPIDFENFRIWSWQVGGPLYIQISEPMAKLKVTVTAKQKPLKSLIH
jgi:hypothetical protein